MEEMQGIPICGDVPVRKVHWEPDNADHWIQWTIKDDAAILWAYDPDADTAVEVLRVREK